MDTLFDSISRAAGSILSKRNWLASFVEIVIDVFLPKKVGFALGCYVPCTSFFCGPPRCITHFSGTMQRNLYYCTACSSHGVTGCGVCGDFVEFTCSQSTHCGVAK